MICYKDANHVLVLIATCHDALQFSRIRPLAQQLAAPFSFFLRAYADVGRRISVILSKKNKLGRAYFQSCYSKHF